MIVVDASVLANALGNDHSDGVLAGSIGLSSMPAGLGVPGYVAPLVVITASYALFQAANNTGVMSNVRSNQRGLVSGMVNLSRNLGLITGASVLGAVFAFSSGITDHHCAPGGHR